MKPSRFLEKAAELYCAKDEEYGDSWMVAGDLFLLLFPDGIDLRTAQDHRRFQAFSLMVVKVLRYAKNFRPGHPDSLNELMVYTAILAAIDSLEKK